VPVTFLVKPLVTSRAEATGEAGVVVVDQTTAMGEPRGPYRPRLERRAGGRMEITERDVAIVQLVCEHRALTQTLIADALELVGPRPSPTNLSRRLSGLYHDAGLLERLEPARRETFRGDAFAYAPTAKGEKLLRDRQLELPFPARSNWKRRNEKANRNARFTHHTVMIARARIAMERAVREVPSLAIEASEREPEGVTWQYRGRTCRVWPDAFVELRERDTERRLAFFVECDRDTMESKRMRWKLEDYALLEHAGHDRTVFGARDALVLVIAETRARADFLLDLAADVERESPLWDIRKRVLVTAEETYVEHPENIFAQVWRSAALPDERAAIIPSPLPRR